MKQDKILGLVLVLFSALMYWQAELLPPAMFGTLGAAAFPKLIFTLLGLSGAGLIVKAFMAERKLAAAALQADGQAATPKAQKPAGINWADYTYVFIGFLSFMLYVALMYYFGYLISTLVFLPAFMWILGPRTKKSAVLIGAVSLGLTFIMQYSFVNLLKVFLPTGSLF